MKYTQTLENRAYDALKMIDLRSDEFQADLMDFFIEKPLGDWQRFEDELLDSITDKILVPKVKKYLAAWLSDLKKAKKDREKTMKTMMVNPPDDLFPRDRVKKMLADMPALMEAVFKLPSFRVDDDGIWDRSDGTRICSTPFVITMHYGSAQDTGDRYEVRYLRQEGKRIKAISKIYPVETLISQRDITSLSKDGIIITTRTAGAALDYVNQLIANLNDVCALGYGISTSTFGWVEFEHPETGERMKVFAPYEPGTVFSEISTYKALYDDVIAVKGDPDEYMEAMKGFRALRAHEFSINLAAALCGVMLGTYFDSSPFLIHVYGVTNKGKSTWARLAMSQFGKPDDGTLMGKYDGTRVGIENKMGLFNNLPIVVDDILASTDAKQKDLQGFIYNIVTGSGRDVGASGSRAGSNRVKKTWKTVFLSSGEGPLSTNFTKGGALNRVLEIPIKPRFDKLTLKKINRFALTNHGHVIRDWLKVLREVGKDAITEIYQDYTDKIIDTNEGVTSRQAEPLAMILTADKLATDYIYKDGVYLDEDLETLCSYLKTEEDVSDGARAVRAIYDYVSSNPSSFILDKVEDGENVKSQDGWINNREIFVIPSCFKKICREQGFDDSVVVEYCKDAGILPSGWADQKGYPKTYKIPGKTKYYRAYRLDMSNVIDRDQADANAKELEAEYKEKFLKMKPEQQKEEAKLEDAPKDIKLPFEENNDGIQYPVFTMGKEMNNHDTLTL